MIVIYKYPLHVEDEQVIEIYEHAELLCVQNKKEIPILWAKVNTENKLRPIKIKTFRTGHDMEFIGSNIYIGSYQLGGGDFIGHVYWEV